MLTFSKTFPLTRDCFIVKTLLVHVPKLFVHSKTGADSAIERQGGPWDNNYLGLCPFDV